jgi:hypothetical protein
MAFGSRSGSVYNSQSQGGGFSTSSRASGSKGSTTDEVADEDSVSISSSVNSDDETSDLVKRSDTAKDGSKHLPRAAQAKQPPTEAELGTLVNLCLAETSTITLLNIPSMCVSNDSFEEVVMIKAANAKYRDVCVSFPNLFHS